MTAACRGARSAALAATRAGLLLLLAVSGTSGRPLVAPELAGADVVQPRGLQAVPDELAAAAGGRYIVMFAPGADAAAAEALLGGGARGAAAAGGQADVELLGSLGQPAGEPTAPRGVAAAASPGGAAGGGVQGAVVSATPDAVQRLRRSPLVAAVIPDLPLLPAGWQDARPAGDAAAPRAVAAGAEPSAGGLPRVPLAAGEQVPTGVARIEAATAAGVVSSAGVPPGRQVVVGIIDSGIDASHPDLNYAGGVSFVKNDTDAGRDGFGHGTHLAGIVGARNNGAGLVGVSPGVPLFSLRIMDDSGFGLLSGMLSAVKWAAVNGRANGLRVINLSLAAHLPASSPGYALTLASICPVFAEASAAGVLSVVAAGNAGEALADYLPAACPGVAAVTALDGAGDGPAGFSNWLPADAAPEERRRVVAAPGSDINSTVSFVVDPSGYAVKSGTSMAAPHVAGAAANCLMGGGCASPIGYKNLEPMRAAAQRRRSARAAGAQPYVRAAAAGAAGRYYGWLVWGPGA
ncbi:apr [Scenedesmus sp. PABB004]|nr:apr [Scenedesmus sp. PABB004]